MTDRVKNIDRGVKTESIEESSETLFLSKQQITHEHQFSKALLEKSLDGLVTLLSQTQSSCIAENLTPSQLRADDSPKLTSTLAICVYEQPGNKRKAKAREILEWELAYASARQRLTAHVRALLNLCVLSRMENIEFDKDLAFQTIQEKLELLKARLQSAGVGVEKKRVLLAQNLLEAEYLIEKGLFFNSRNKQEEALACFKQALQPAFVGAEMGFRKWLLASLKWTAVGEMKAKHWLQGAVYFTDYCGRCLFHIREVVLQQSTPAVYSDSKNHVEKSNVEPRSQLKYFIPGNFVESFLNLCDCLFHLRLYEAASICLNYISSVVLSVDDEEITGRHFELKMNVNDSINREKRKALVSEDEDWDSEFGSLDAEELHPRFSNLFGDKFTQLNSEKDHRLTLLKEQMEVRSSFLKNSAFIKYPKPTVLYSLRLADGRMQLHEKEYESWLLHYSFVDDSKYKEGQQNLEVWSDSNKSIPTSNVILDRLKRLDQVTLEWAEMYFLLIWDTFREKKFSLMFKYADNYFSALHGANSVLSIDERKDDKKYEKLFQMSMEIEKIVRTSIKYSSTNTSMTTMKKNLHIIECTFPEMILRIKLYKVQCRGHNCLENENSTDFLEVTKNLLEIQRACCNIDNESWLSFETWDSINFDSVAFSTKDLDVQVDAIASLYFFLCERSPLTGKPLIHAGRNEGAIIPRRKDFQGLMKKLKLQYESIPSASHIKAKTAFVLAHYGFHSTGDKATAERQLFEALVIWKQYSNDHLTYPVPLLTGEFVQEVLNFLANILLQNGKAIYSLAASTAEHVVDFFMSKSQSIPVLLRCVRISKTAGLYPIAIGYLLQILETYLVPRAKLEFISYLLQTIDLAVEFGYFSCALELVECGVNYIQESINTSEQNAIRMNESKAKNLEKRLSSCSSNWRTRSFEELRIRSGILLTATGHFEAAQKSFRSLSLQSRDNRITLLCRLYLTEIDGMLNRHTECLSFCEQFERMTSLTVGQLFENVRLSFHLSLWDLDLTISEVAVFIKIRCLLRKQQFIEALRNTDFAFIKFHRGQLRHLGRLYYLRGKILTQMMIHLKDNVVCQSSNCFTTCFITKTERLVGPRTIQISSQGAQSMERRLEWRFSIQSKEDLVSQAVDSLFRSIGYFKKTGQDFLVAKAQLYIGKLINAYLSTQLRVEGTFKWSFLKENVRNYFKYFSKIENLEDIQADRLLISACKIWKHIYSLNELLNGYITLIEYYCLTGYDSGASYLFSECWLLLSDLFLTDLNIQSCIQLETSRSIEFVIKKLSKMAWILVTFFSEEEIQHYLLVFDALNNLKSRCYQMDSPSLNCPKDDSDVVQSCNNGHSALTTSDKNSEDHSKKETIEQHSVVGNKSSGITSNIHGCYPFYKNIDKRLNNIWSFAASGNEQVQFTFLEGSKGRHSIFQEGSRTIYELGEGTKKLFLNPQGQIQRIRHRVQQLYPIDISNFIEEIFSLNSKYSTYPIMELKQLYDTSWSIFYHLKMLKYQHLRGKLKNMEDWSRLNWRGWMEWLSISRGIRQESHCVNNIPKELAFKSLFIDYFDQCLLIYAPFRQIQYSIPLYRRFKGGETDSSIQQEGTLPLPFEVEKLLKELMLNEDNYVLRDVLPFQISMCFGRRKQSKSSQVTSKHIISSSALHSLLHNDSKLFRDTQFTLFVDPDIAFIPWEFILDIDAIRSESLSRLSYFWYRGQNNSTPCSISKVFWFDEKDGGSKNDFFITKKGSSQRGKERLETIVDFYWKRLIMDHATREEWRPWQGPIPMSYERSSSWLERWKDGRVETPHLLEANAIDLLRCFQLKNDAVHIPCFIFTFMDGLPRPWTTLGTFLECLPQAVSLFVPTKYMETFLQEHFPSIEHAK
ncbi:uncharacterized protein Gasu_04480 [Galdieria sulphuraria]|uniref:Uncharacterized protein n=1 Tax=Galdieria sulphuraria TaxID=130081 RepID=M2W930_GALSU|nr:uncharacterized protein Gasu_04480 [Galdieria sulphuraria]EME32356.1 hypothetical protein Gasu_04480 [Galdieria sulphuraria]|eukprot:XP_005708876.1 hypothetical protein Gasu_04480 [Galdieria sulphuraria]